jgi:xanthine dehydrogenase accessory factor
MPNSLSEIVPEVLSALDGGPAVVTATVVSTPAGSNLQQGDKILIRRDGSTIGSLGGGQFEQTLVRLAQEAFPTHSSDSVYLLRDGTELRRSDPRAGQALQVLLEVIESPATLLVVGGGHIGRSLAKLGAEVGFSVAVLDDRPEFASPELIPEADKVICADFEEALAEFPIDENTYIVMVTRGHKQDELSLRTTIQSNAAYVGMIGSRRRTGAVLQHLAEDGIPRAALDRVHTPIGLDIGAETPEEIAVSIIAEIIMERRGGGGGSMYYRRGQPVAEAQPASD